MRHALVIFVCFVFALSSSPPEPLQVAAQSSAALRAEPAGIDVTLGLGQSFAQQITLTNDSILPVQPLLYEAYELPDQPQFAAMQPLQVALPQQLSRIDRCV